MKRMRQLTSMFGVIALAVAALTASIAGAQPADATPSCSANVTSLDNGSFEAPVIPNASYRQVKDATVPGWSTTATDQLIELWSSGFNGVQAAAGRQFAELNATQSSALYQDLPTNPGQTLTWSLAHRARQGTDTMRVLIGTPGHMVQVAVLSDTTAAWGRHTGTYTVPAGQTSTRFAFESVSTGSGNQTIGNFLDDISFGTPACVTAAKQVLPTGSANVGDQLTYVVQLTNQGGAATSALTLTDVIPAGTTYVVGSASANASLSGSTLTFTPAGASGETGVLEPGATATVTFQVEVQSAAALSTVSNTANVSYNDGITTNTFATNTVTTPIGAAADIELKKLFSGTGSAISAGGSTTMSLIAKNLGPNDATGVVVSDNLPTGMSPNGPLPTGCSIAGQLITCAAGALALNAIAQFDIQVNAPSSAGIVFNTARVVSASFDPNPSNDEATAGLTVSPASPANVQLAKTGSPDTARAGDVAAYQLTIFNGGQSATGSAITLTDPVPAGFAVSSVTVDPTGAFVTCTGTTTITCTIASGFNGTLTGSSPVNTVHVNVLGRVNSTVANGTVLANTASLSTGPTASSNITVNAAADVFLTKTLTTSTDPGVPASYQVTVINAGPATAVATVVTDTLPDGTTMLTTPNNCTSAGQVLTCAMGDMAPGTVQTLSYEISIPNAGGSFTNHAVATSTTPIIDPAGATDSVTFSVAAFAKLAATGASLSALWIGIVLLIAGGIAFILYVVRRRKSD